MSLGLRVLPVTVCVCVCVIVVCVICVVETSENVFYFNKNFSLQTIISMTILVQNEHEFKIVIGESLIDDHVL